MHLCLERSSFHKWLAYVQSYRKISTIVKVQIKLFCKELGADSNWLRISFSWVPDRSRVTSSAFIGVCFPSDKHTLIKQEKRSVLLFFFFGKEIGTVPTLMFLFISNPLPRGDLWYVGCNVYAYTDYTEAHITHTHAHAYITHACTLLHLDFHRWLYHSHPTISGHQVYLMFNKIWVLLFLYIMDYLDIPQ